MKILKEILAELKKLNAHFEENQKQQQKQNNESLEELDKRLGELPPQFQGILSSMIKGQRNGK